ncbi:OLC1v1020490C1 [Oldenlandia corymbosa var. corymbosa]|uniref:OLC1v1020490C1 n=1 Tax=Oldenlandia corymbosa var. corymbosa TaxID=529605 RepID=A0AAV1EGP0_OLDCO|nr:OLC1v1020490C1 [Oldenlandia corymbosa var. corymbosa]
MAGAGKIPEEAVTVVMVAFPAQGHLNMLLHLARLIASYNIPVHYVCTPPHIRQAKLRVHGWNPDSISNIHFHGFPVPHYEAPPPDPNSAQKVPVHQIPAILSSVHLRDPVFQLMKTLSSSSTKRLVVIHDALMTYVIGDIGLVPNAESYAFSVSSALCSYSALWELAGKPEGVPEFQLLQVLPRLNYPQELQEFVRLLLGTKITSSGTLINSCTAIDGPFLDHRTKFKSFGSDKVWAVGPLHPLHHVMVNDEEDQGQQRHYCLDWLDKQAPHSVIFVTFGSSTTLSDEEIKEMAIGLEKSKQKFLWVLRDADKGDISNHEGGDDQVKEVLRVGLPVLPEFLSSDPHAEKIQVTSKDIENTVRKLMDSAEGHQMRQRAQEVSIAVKASTMDNGTPFGVDSFVAHIRR